MFAFVVLFFVVYTISEALAMRTWLLLLIYTETAMTILYASLPLPFREITNLILSLPLSNSYVWQVTREWSLEVADRWDFATELIG